MYFSAEQKKNPVKWQHTARTGGLLHKVMPGLWELSDVYICLIYQVCKEFKSWGRNFFVYCTSQVGLWHVIEMALKDCFFLSKLTEDFILHCHRLLWGRKGNSKIDEEMLHAVILDYVILPWICC